MSQLLLPAFIVVAFSAFCSGCGYFIAFIVTRNKWRDEMIERRIARYDCTPANGNAASRRYLRTNPAESAAKPLTHDEARRTAANIAKLPDFCVEGNTRAGSDVRFGVQRMPRRFCAFYPIKSGTFCKVSSQQARLGRLWEDQGGPIKEFEREFEREGRPRVLPRYYAPGWARLKEDEEM